MNAWNFPSLRSWIPAAVCLLCLPLSAARAVSFGTVADWRNAPNQTIAVGDKNFVWLADSGNWDGSENVNLAAFPAANAESFGIDQLEGYLGPLTLSIAYRIDITSFDVFSAVALDQDYLLSTVTTNKDIYGSLQELEDNPTPGSGTVAALAIVDFVPTPPPPVPLPPLTSIWVRDTVTLTSGAALQSISNTYFQAVPEPGTGSLTLTGIGLAALLRARRSVGSRAADRGRHRPRVGFGAGAGADHAGPAGGDAHAGPGIDRRPSGTPR
jgi:hypothetical protein